MLVAIVAGLAGCGKSASDVEPSQDAGSGRAAVPAASAHPAVGDASGPLVRNVVLVSIDTLRADRTEPYGCRRKTTPNLAALAKRGVVFENALSQAAQTAPSHASMFTSQYEETHGVVNVNGPQDPVHSLAPNLTTLAALLAGEGVETAAFVSDGNLTRHMDLDRGFKTWDEKNEDVKSRVRAAVDWLGARPQEPFFLFVHTYQVHAPYVPPAEYAARFTEAGYDGPLKVQYERYAGLSMEEAWSGVGRDYWKDVLQYTDRDVRYLSDLYDGEVAYTDSCLRDLLERVLTGPLGSSTALIITADHGEEFKDHGKFQHDQVFQELLHVPLIVHLPSPLERAGWTGRVAEPVELIDVAPTIAELLGVEWRKLGWQGLSLVPAMDPARRVGALSADRPCYSGLTLLTGPKSYHAIVWAGWKYIWCHQQDVDKTWEWLFDLRADPHELHSLLEGASGEASAMLARLKSALDDRETKDAEIARVAGEGGAGDDDAAWRSELEQLGYTGK